MGLGGGGEGEGEALLGCAEREKWCCQSGVKLGERTEGWRREKDNKGGKGLWGRIK